MAKKSILKEQSILKEALLKIANILYLILFSGLFGFAPNALAWCDMTVGSEIFELPQSFCSYGPYNQGVVIDGDDGYFFHFYWNTSNHNITDFTYTPSTRNIQFCLNYATSTPWVSSNVGGTDGIQQYYEAPFCHSNGFTLPQGTNWAYACSKIQVSDKSIVMTNTATSKTCSGPITSMDFKLDFPLPGQTAYTSKVASIFDHSGPFYRRDGVILAYTNEEGKRENGVCRYSGSTTIIGYKKADGTQISILGQGSCLWYDGHSGYDYPTPKGTPILAAQDGILCISTSITSPNQKRVWRNSEHCPYGNDPINGLNKKATSWDGWHAFYVVHGIENYTTWYLHSTQLEPAMMKGILENGYIQVIKGQTIAYVGHWGLSGGNHLHFEARKGSRQVIDPYGWENQPVLWAEQN